MRGGFDGNTPAYQRFKTVPGRLGTASEFRLEVSWHADTTAKAERLRATMQRAPLVELASIALALAICARIAPLGRLDVTEFGDRVDYRSRKRRSVLEISGTETAGELQRRHSQKVMQARQNPFGWSAYVIVCAFSASGHRILVSEHPAQESTHE